MKQTLLLMVLALGMCIINVSCQSKKKNSAKRTTTVRSTNTEQEEQTMKFRQEGEDGYVWYMLKKGNLFSARDSEGNNIIPIKYDKLNYVCSEYDGTHYFWVKSGDFYGGYTAKEPLSCHLRDIIQV